MKDSTDRRATQRFQAKPGNRIIYGATAADIRDLSLDGVFVLDPDPLPVGSEVIFTLQAGEQEIALEGIVRHLVEQEGMGIQFTNVSSVSKRRLRIHIAGLVPAPGQTVKA
jgi:PilZ domain